jgi:hypothetical protein
MWDHTTCQGAQGPVGPPNPMASQTLSWFGPRLGGYVHTSVPKRILCPRVSGNEEEWPAVHMDGRLTVHHLQTDSIMSVEAPLYPNIRILTVGFTHTTLFM